MIDIYRYYIRCGMNKNQYILYSENEKGTMIIHADGTKSECIELYKKNFDRPYSNLEVTER